MNNAVTKELENINQLSQEALRILDILDKIQDHTADLRKKLIAELKPKNETVHLKLDNF